MLYKTYIMLQKTYIILYKAYIIIYNSYIIPIYPKEGNRPTSLNSERIRCERRKVLQKGRPLVERVNSWILAALKGLIGSLQEIINLRNFPQKKIKYIYIESNEHHTKRLTPRTSTNCLIRNLSPELFQKIEIPTKLRKIMKII